MNSVTVNALGRDWLWPQADRECRAVVFDWSGDLDATYAALKTSKPKSDGETWRTCVQAGGNMGVWPWLLAQNFTHVYTFEPDPLCFYHLVRNVEQANVHFFQAALGRTRRLVNLTPVPANLGAQFIDPTHAPGNIPTLRIDDLGLKDCDLIYLDIEGYELEALYGAYNTIGHSLPVIVVEDKGLSDKYGTPKDHIERWLWHEFKYEVAARPHRDVVLVPPKG